MTYSVVTFTLTLITVAQRYFFSFYSSCLVSDYSLTLLGPLLPVTTIYFHPARSLYKESPWQMSRKVHTDGCYGAQHYSHSLVCHMLKHAFLVTF